jgi:hypothetical protein
MGILFQVVCGGTEIGDSFSHHLVTGTLFRGGNHLNGNRWLILQYPGVGTLFQVAGGNHLNGNRWLIFPSPGGGNFISGWKPFERKSVAHFPTTWWWELYSRSCGGTEIGGLVVGTLLRDGEPLKWKPSYLLKYFVL